MGRLNDLSTEKQTLIPKLQVNVNTHHRSSITKYLFLLCFYLQWVWWQALLSAVWLTWQRPKVGVSNITDEVIRGLPTRHQSLPPGGRFTTTKRTLSAGGTERERHWERERASGGRKDQIRVGGESRSNGLDKKRLAVEHAEAQHRRGGRKKCNRRKNEKRKAREWEGRDTVCHCDSCQL